MKLSTTVKKSGLYSVISAKLLIGSGIKGYSTSNVEYAAQVKFCLGFLVIFQGVDNEWSLMVNSPSGSKS